jgi:hypothetical protein
MAHGVGCRMKRSAYVRLVLLGSVAGLYGCDSPEALEQQRYASLDDCEKDWGDSTLCRHVPSSTSWNSGYYFGPRYYWDRAADRPMVVNGDGTVRVAHAAHIARSGSALGETHAAGNFARGGFGGIGRAFGAGG